VSSPLLSNELLLAQNVQPKATTPGTVQDSAPPSGAAGPSSTSPLASLSPMLLVAALFIPILLLTNRKQKKEAQARAGLKKGDRVMSNAGFIGELVEFDDRVAKVKIAPGVVVQMVANTVSPYVEPASKPAAAAPKELKEAKAGSEKK
jgi:preprotein translocase subunit YajC